MAKSTCRFCGRKDEIFNLVEVCGCHKKSDNALCHRSCIEQYISRGAQSEDDQVSSAAKRCPTCKQPFRVKLKNRWTVERCCSGVSVGQYFNLTMIIISSIGFFISVINLLQSGELKTQGSKTLMWVMFMLVAIMTVFVFAKIYDRWKRNQTDVEVIDIV